MGGERGVHGIGEEEHDHTGGYTEDQRNLIVSLSGEINHINRTEWHSGDRSEEIEPTGDHFIRSEDTAGEQWLEERLIERPEIIQIMIYGKYW